MDFTNFVGQMNEKYNYTGIVGFLIPNN